MRRKSVFHMVCSCGAHFTADHNQARYCSDECRQAAKRKAWNEYGQRNAESRKQYRKNYYAKNKDQIVARIDAYKKTEAGKIARQNCDFNSRVKFPEKYQARQEVLKAVRKGKLVKQPCMFCGEEKVEAHHSDYSKPLKVDWMCPTCHKEFHREEMKDAV